MIINEGNIYCTYCKKKISNCNFLAAQICKNCLEILNLDSNLHYCLICNRRLDSSQILCEICLKQACLKYKIIMDEAEILTYIENRIGKIQIKHFDMNIVELKLSVHDNSTLNLDFGIFKELRSIFIHSNNGESIPSFFLDNCIGKNEFLMDLSIFNLELTPLPFNFQNLKFLRNLILVSNNLTFFPIKYPLHQLTTLRLDRNELRYLPDLIGDFRHLQELSVCGNNLQNLPHTIGNLRNLRILKLDGNNINEFPKIICKLYNLVELHIGNNSISKLPNNFGDLRNLQILDLRNNNLNQLPLSFSNLNKLETLNLSLNNFDEFPEILMNLISIRFIYLFSNSIKRLPFKLQNFDFLEHLSLNYNFICEFPSFKGELNNLKYLGLKGSRNLIIPHYLLDRKLLKIDLEDI